MRRKLTDGILQVILIVLAAAWLVPLVWTVLTSFKSPNDANALTSFFGGLQWSLQNFTSAWNSGPFVMYYINTIEIVTGILILQLITITLAGYAFARLQFPGQNVLFVLFLLQLMVPVSALIVPNYATVNALGLVNHKLGIMLPYFASATGTFLMRQTFRQVPKELEEAAKLDGARWWQTIWHVFIPMARPAMVAFSLVSISFHWNDFLWPLIIAQTQTTQPLTVGLTLLTQMGETGAEWSMITAGTLIVILPLLVLFLVFQKQFINSFMQSGLK